jgi:hypothetical protein
MSREKVDVVRQKLILRERSGRGLEQRKWVSLIATRLRG